MAGLKGIDGVLRSSWAVRLAAASSRSWHKAWPHFVADGEIKKLGNYHTPR